MEGLGYDDREISGLDTDTVVQRAAQFCQVKDQEKSEHQEGFTTGKSLLAGIANRLTEPDHNRSQHA